MATRRLFRSRHEDPPSAVTPTYSGRYPGWQVKPPHLPMQTAQWYERQPVIEFNDACFTVAGAAHVSLWVSAVFPV